VLVRAKASSLSLMPGWRNIRRRGRKKQEFSVCHPAESHLATVPSSDCSGRARAPGYKDFSFGTLDQYLALFGAALSLSAGGNVIKSRTIQAASSRHAPGPEATARSLGQASG